MYCEEKVTEMKHSTFFKIILCIPLVLVAGIFLLYILSPIYNDHVAKNLVRELQEIPLPEKTELIEEKSMAAKLCGNGNGMEYFGALLIKSDLTQEDLNTYYTRFGEKYHVKPQNDNEIKQIETQAANFNTSIDGDDYYILYTWGNYHGIFSEFDLRGH